MRRPPLSFTFFITGSWIVENRCGFAAAYGDVSAACAAGELGGPFAGTGPRGGLGMLDGSRAAGVGCREEACNLVGNESLALPLGQVEDLARGGVFAPDKAR